MSKDKDTSGSGNGTKNSKGGETDARKEAAKEWAAREKIIKEAQEKHGGKGKDNKK